MDLFQAIARSYENHLSVKLTLAYGFVLIVLYAAFWWYVDYDGSQSDGSSSTPQ
jgi:hypothetical protein